MNLTKFVVFLWSQVIQYLKISFTWSIKNVIWFCEDLKVVVPCTTVNKLHDVAHIQKKHLQITCYSFKNLAFGALRYLLSKWKILSIYVLSYLHLATPILLRHSFVLSCAKGLIFTKLEIKWEQSLHDNQPTVDRVRDEMRATTSW